MEKGSGIGFVASGEISDSVFSGSDGERQFFMRHEVKRERHIKAYFRYSDDIFLIARGGNGKLGTFAKHWKHVAVTYKSPYLIEGLCLVSLLSIWTLNGARAHVGKHMRMLDSRTHIKPSSLRRAAVSIEFSSEVRCTTRGRWSEIRRFARRSTKHKRVHQNQRPVHRET